VGAVTSLSGAMTIPETLGRLQGGNLFHSFSGFNINTGESANFTTTTTTIANVISRVTGGSPSMINGLLKLTPAAGTPGFYFINPAGITFGAGASIDMPGAFHVSTADYVKFPDGDFYADLSKTSTFSTATPESFGFLATTPAKLEITGGAVLDNGNNSIEIAAGDIVIDNAAVSTQTSNSNAAGDISISSYGNLNITNLALIGSTSTSGNGAAGNVKIFASNDIALLTRGVIKSITEGTGNAGNIAINSQNLTLSGKNTQIRSETFFGSGNAGTINVNTTQDVSIIGGATIQTQSYATGNAGSISVHSSGNVILDGQNVAALGLYDTGLFSKAVPLNSPARSGNIEVVAKGDLIMRGGAIITTDTKTLNDAGLISIDVGRLFLMTGTATPTRISSSTEPVQAAGNAGSIQIHSAGNISLSGGTQISTSSTSVGNAGSININSGGGIDIIGGGSIYSTGIFSDATYASGAAGKIEIDALGDVSVKSARISTSSSSDGRAGSIKVSANSISLDGARIQSIASKYLGLSSAGIIDLTAAKDFAVLNGTQISSDTLSGGNAGDIHISSANLLMSGGSLVSTRSFYGSNGNAGNVTISTAGNLSIYGGAKISSNTDSTGTAGSVRIDAGTLLVDGYLAGNPSSYSAISAAAETHSHGQTGNVTVAANDITLSNGGRISIQNDATVADPSLLTPTTVTVTAPRITLRNASITAASSGNVAASNIAVNFTDRLYLDPSAISTSAQGGNGGSIAISGGSGLLWLDNSQITTSVLGLNGNGGDISINAGLMFMNTGFIQANTAAVGASGGAVNINVPFILASGNNLHGGGNTAYVYQPGVFGYNVIQAAAPDGVSGAINMTGPVLDVAGRLAAIGAAPLQSGGVGRNVCETTEGSSLSSGGWQSLPTRASDPL
jgi:filamentous hemagglutinin family protein